MEYRVGFGYDIHKLVEGRKLILGGVHVPYKKGLLGHSDADVLVHSIIDALLGAMGEGDIGRVFGVDKPRLLGITSLCLLEEVQELLKERKFKVGNLDSVIIAQEPMLSPFIPEMQKNIATALKTSVEKVNIKSSTTQGLGIVGVGEAICANTVTTIK